MSKHIGGVFAYERNAGGPQANVDASVAGVEVALFDPSVEPHRDATKVAFQPDDARTYAALVVRAADEVERMRIEANPIAYLRNRLMSAESALKCDGRTQFECHACHGLGCDECQQTGMALKSQARAHFARFPAPKEGGGS